MEHKWLLKPRDRKSGDYIKELKACYYGKLELLEHLNEIHKKEQELNKTKKDK